MKKLFFIIPLFLLLLLSCTSLDKLRKEINDIDDAVVEAIVDQVEAVLTNHAKEVVETAALEAGDQVYAMKQVDSKFLKKSVERLEPIIQEAMKTIEPALVKAAEDIKTQVKTEILEELIGEEIEAPIAKPAEEEKPVDKVEEVKPAEKPVEEAKPAEKPAEEVKTAEEPVVEAKPAEKPSEETKPVVEAKPAEAPVAEKPAEAPAK